jgi:hypothetical protein
MELVVFDRAPDAVDLLHAGYIDGRVSVPLRDVTRVQATISTGD